MESYIEISKDIQGDVRDLSIWILENRIYSQESQAIQGYNKFR